MSNLPPLITDLALIMGAAAIVTLVFRRLKQPTVLGYILAGLLVGPNFHLFPTVTDLESVETWAQIGVIILLFCLGLEFSFKKLARVGGPASVTAIIEVVVMLCIGFGTGKALGWPAIDSIFLGAMLSISSTTIIIRAFDELGVKEKKFAGLVFGVLVIQDLVAILMLVLLPTLAISSGLTGTAVLYPVAKLVFFLVLWFVSGIFFLPTVLRKMNKFMNDEMLLVTSLALCFLMVILATGAGFSSALGAFIMGSILAETRVGQKIEHLTVSIKEMFGAVFFISVGMLIDPAIIPQYWKQILLIATVVLLGQPLIATIGALLSRQPLKTSVQAGMSLSQIGEFSFIIATMGLSLKLTSSFLYPIAVAVSALTTFTTPYMIRLSTPVYNLLDKKLPGKWKLAIERYSAVGNGVKATSDWNKFLRSYILQTVIHTILVTGIVFLMLRFGLPIFGKLKDTPLVRFSAAFTTLLLIAPFLWALAIRRIQDDAALRLWNNKYYKGPMIVLQVVRLVIAAAVIGFVLHSIISYFWAVVALLVLVALIVINYKKLQLVHLWIERRFIMNLDDKEKQQQKASGAHLTPWDAHIASFIVSPDFNKIGKTLMELQLRETFGVNIAMIKRGAFTIPVPDRQERIYPEDVLYVIGTDDQVVAFKKYLAANSNVVVKKSAEEELSLERITLSDGSVLVGKTIKESAIRERTKVLIVGIERNDERMLNPESNVVLEKGDLLWIVGNIKRIKVLEKMSIKSKPAVIAKSGERFEPGNLTK
ncbi:MAG: sodium:proton antiporter [Flavipsychrobacter sp.]|nr:sodium:proton antiporter [Flavipsychrobacter sp.]